MPILWEWCEPCFKCWPVPTSTSDKSSEFQCKLHVTAFDLSTEEKLLPYFFSVWWVVKNSLEKKNDQVVIWDECLPSLRPDCSGPGKCFVS